MAMTEKGVSRRRLLKRAGVGAAVLGAGSMATASTAGAATSPSAVECIHSGGCGVCGAPACVENPSCCFCWITTEGCCICGESSFCDPHRNCLDSSNCPPGYACAFTCCGSVCVPTCGTCDHFTECCNETLAQGRATDRGAGAAGGGGHTEAPAGGGHGHH